MGLLEQGLERLGVPRDENRIDALHTYLEELERWNRRYGLVNAQGEELVVRHLLDSLAALPIFRSLPHAAIADVGSGAGLPGIPIALFLDDARVTLVERSGRRAAFLRNVVPLCGLGQRVTVDERELDRVAERFDIVTARAFAALDDAVDGLLRITAPGGAIVAYKGRRAVASAELDAAFARLEAAHTGSPGGFRAELLPIEVPFLDEERTVVLIRR